MSDATRRALRTLLQAASGGLITSFLDLFVIAMSDAQVGGLTAILTVLSAALMNYLEDEKGLPAAFYPGGDKTAV